MEIRLLKSGYKKDIQFYESFLNGCLIEDGYISDESVLIPDNIPDFPIFFAVRDENDKYGRFVEMIKMMDRYFIKLDRDIFMDEIFWHSYLCLYKKDFLVKQYPEIKNAYGSFKNIVVKDFDWENYIYKGILIAQYVSENVEENKKEHFYGLILDNMDMFNYIIKYEIFRNGKFLINIMKIIEETGLGSLLKAKIKDRPDLGNDQRYGRRVIYEFNKSYPIILSPMLDKDSLKQYFLKYLSYYMEKQEKMEQTKNVADTDENMPEEEIVENGLTEDIEKRVIEKHSEVKLQKNSLSRFDEWLKKDKFHDYVIKDYNEKLMEIWTWYEENQKHSFEDVKAVEELDVLPVEYKKGNYKKAYIYYFKFLNEK